MTKVKKITSIADLNAVKQQALAEIELRGAAKDLAITVHMGTCGIAAGARDVLSALMSELSTSGVGNVTIRQAGCVGLCDKEPMISLTDKAGGLFRYGRLDRNKVRQIVQEHVVRGQAVAEHLLKQ